MERTQNVTLRTQRSHIFHRFILIITFTRKVLRNDVFREFYLDFIRCFEPRFWYYSKRHKRNILKPTQENVQSADYQCILFRVTFGGGGRGGFVKNICV